jgi:Enolase C-terminal domain-like
MAKKIAIALAPYTPAWFEDPIRMSSPQALGEYARSTDVWVYASETLGSRWAYKDFFERDAIDVAMVDLCWTGGLTEGRKIAALAETWHRPFAPHDCTGPVRFRRVGLRVGQSAQHIDPGDGARILHRMVPGTCHRGSKDRKRLRVSHGRGWPLP